jgi:hypothetical protein
LSRLTFSLRTRPSSWYWRQFLRVTARPLTTLVKEFEIQRGVGPAGSYWGLVSDLWRLTGVNDSGRADSRAGRYCGEVGCPNRAASTLAAAGLQGTTLQSLLGENRLLAARGPPYSTLSSAQPGRVEGLLFRNTMRRVLGKGRFDASARL